MNEITIFFENCDTQQLSKLVEKSWMKAIQFLNSLDSHSYSVRRLFTGFAIAAFTD